MQAVVITGAGGVEVLDVREVEQPAVGVEDVLVRVRASALNRADLLQRQGRYPAPPGAPPDIPGLEFAGEVASVGASVNGWPIGTRVFGITAGGAHAQFAAVHHSALARVPAQLSWEEAAAIPEAFITAHDALVTQAVVASGDRVLIHAVGSGVGLAAAQLARAIGAVPFGTARSEDKIARARELGLEDGATVTDPAAIPDLVTQWSGGRGMDVVLDLVGGAYLESAIRSAARGGRIMLIGTMGGPTATISLGIVLRQRLTVRGTVLRSRSIAEKAQVTAAFVRDVVPLVERRTVVPVIDSVYALESIRDAHERMASNATFGKVVLRVP
jgi:NADPH2:quinone reductase